LLKIKAEGTVRQRSFLRSLKKTANKNGSHFTNEVWSGIRMLRWTARSRGQLATDNLRKLFATGGGISGGRSSRCVKKWDTYQYFALPFIFRPAVRGQLQKVNVVSHSQQKWFDRHFARCWRWFVSLSSHPCKGKMAFRIFRSAIGYPESTTARPGESP